MSLSSGPESAAPRRGRRIVLALLILLLIALPLYLWPLRGGGGGLPGAAAVSRPPLDPRDAAAVAQLPADVWEGLMGGSRGSHGAAPSEGSGNLTRIGPLDDDPAGPFAIDGGSLPPRYDALPHGDEITALLDGGLDQSSGQSGGADGSLPAPAQFLAGPASGENAGTGSGWGGGGGYSGFPGGLGPFAGGGGPGGPGGPDGPTPTFISDPGISDPGDPSVPAPTPEPGTIVLVGLNIALLGAAAWRRLRGREEPGPVR